MIRKFLFLVMFTCACRASADVACPETISSIKRSTVRENYATAKDIVFAAEETCGDVLEGWTAAYGKAHMKNDNFEGE